LHDEKWKQIRKRICNFIFVSWYNCISYSISYNSFMERFWL